MIAGPAETCCYATLVDIDYRQELPTRVLLAKPLPKYSIYVVNSEMRPVPAGWPGEIVIAGLGLGLDYVSRPELTPKAFVSDTLATSEQRDHGYKTLFRTGDKGRLRADGTLLFDGRLEGNTQTKLTGMHVDLQDIEACILHASEGSLSDAICTVRGEGAGRYIVAHVVFAPNCDLSAPEREAHLRHIRKNLAVPKYMKPTMLIALDAIPTNAHAKVDRAKLAALPLPNRGEAPRQRRRMSSRLRSSTCGTCGARSCPTRLALRLRRRATRISLRWEATRC